MTDLQPVARGIFEKDSVIGFVFPSGAFNVLRPCASGNPREAIDFRGISRPERDSALICHVPGGFCNAEKRGWSAIRCRSFVLTPVWNTRFPRETERGQQHFIKGARLCKIANAKIDMIVKPKYGCSPTPFHMKILIVWSENYKLR
jgi:hypothetical protein